MAAEAPRHAVRQLQQGAPQAVAVVRVPVVGVLLPEALGLGGLGDHLPIVDPLRELEQVVSVGAEAALQTLGVDRGQVADRLYPDLRELLLQLGPHAPQPAHGQRRQERGLGAGGNHHQPVGLAHVGGDLGHQLRGGHSHRRAELRLAPHRLFEAPRDLLAGAEGAAAARHVEERLVDRHRLHPVGEPPEDLHDALRLPGVLLHVHRQVGALGAQPEGLGDGHGAPHPEDAGLVGRGGDDPAPAAPQRARPHDHGLAPQLRAVALLHRRVERVHVDVEDRPGCGVLWAVRALV